ncbi:MAG: restriction endonuclease subunit S [Nitrospirae bacterium]|nr:restriction endonuclease subunit S [Nitrospirota bacterium]
MTRRKIKDLIADNAILEVQDGNHGEKHPTAADYIDDGVPFLMARDFQNGQVDLRSACKIPKSLGDSLRIGFARTGDVLLTHKGTIGLVAIVPEVPDYVMLTPQVTYYRTNPAKLMSSYLKYAFQTPFFRDQLNSFSAQSTRPYIGITAQKELELDVPALPVQRRIADILSAYDELIENSQRRIRILETMARSLYREWFVLFRFPGHEKIPLVDSPLGKIPKGWEVKRLDEVAENFDRLRKPLSKMKRAAIQGKYPYYGAAKVFDYVNDFIFDGEYLLMAEDGSVITTDRAPVLQLVNEKFWPNNHTHVLRGKSPISTHFLYLGLSLVDISPYITGAAQPKITQENMNRIQFFCAPNELHADFDRLVAPMIHECQVLQCEAQNLCRTRDLLLPRLLSGNGGMEHAIFKA